MKYYFCKLHAPRPTFAQTMTPAEGKLMAEHGAYLRTFPGAVAFGPVADPAGFYGVGIWELPDEADIKAICDGDPTIKSGLGFRYEIHPMPQVVIRK